MRPKEISRWTNLPQVFKLSHKKSGTRRGADQNGADFNLDGLYVGTTPWERRLPGGQASFKLVSTKPDTVEIKEKNEGTLTWKHLILNIEGFHFENQLEAGLAGGDVAGWTLHVPRELSLHSPHKNPLFRLRFKTIR